MRPNVTIARLAIRVCLLALVCAFSRPAHAIPLLNGFGGPAGYGTNELAPNDDGSSAAISITAAFSTGLHFFGSTYTTMYVNTNGNITFAGPLPTYTPSAFPISMQPMIAPWWGDVDTRGDGRPARNGIYWYVEANRIVVTWHMVGYYSVHDDLQNDFQLILTTSATCTSSGDFDVEFRYNQCQWTTGDASGGSGGTGGTPAQVGFDAGNLRDYYSLPMSRTAAIVNVCGMSNVTTGTYQPGLYRFQIRGGGIAGGCTGSGAPCMVPGQQGVCAMGVTQCYGSGTRCQQVNQPGPRRCNGFDNDCDGVIDTGDSLCPAGMVCDRGSCVPRCQPELGCLTGQSCSTEGTCVPTDCLTVTCPAGQRCAGGTCVGICNGVLCPHGQACRAGRCVDPCTEVTCASTEVCQDGMCIPACQCNPCSTGYTCQPDGYCSDSSCLGVTCPTGTYCAGGTCHDSCAHGPDQHLCLSGETCVLGQCVVGGHPTPVDGGINPPDGGNTLGPDGSTPSGPDGGSSLFYTRSSGCGCRVGAPRNDTHLGFFALGLSTVLLRRRRALRPSAPSSR